MYLVIVESPAKARTIKKLLGKKYKVEASMGHLIDLPKSQFGIDVEKRYNPKYITIRGKGDILKKLKAAGKGVDKVYFAADPDREGEAISWHLMRALEVDEEEPCRVEFHEITKNAVKEAFKNPRKIDKNRVDAQQARRVLDRLVGYKISPLLWKKVKKGLSAGRVQSVAIRLICDREEEISAFVPEEYWSISARLTPRYKKDAFLARFWGKGKEKIKLSNKESVDTILESLKESQYFIKKIKKTERKRNPSPPFTTSSLQQDASRRLGFTVRKTMTVAQQLYEGIKVKKEGNVGLITYMRTDSTKISDSAREEAKNYITEHFGKEFYPPKPRFYKSKKGAQEAHEAIRPTSILRSPEMLKSQLSRDQYRLYKLIWERFAASQMASAVFDVVSVDIKASHNNSTSDEINSGESPEYIFKASGSAAKFLGFLVIYDNQDKEEKEKQGVLPELQEGQEIKMLNLDPQQHFTQPPPRYTEASLVKTLEELGIGRPSTYAPTIGTILARGYVIKEQKTILPTELGNIVVDIMKDYFPNIIDVDFTAGLEEKLDQVEEGESPWIDVVDNFYLPFQKDLQRAEKDMEKIQIQDEESDEECEKCGRLMVYKMGRFGKFLACPGFPECRNTKPILKETGISCPVCSGEIVERRTKKGRKFFGCSSYPQCEFISWNKPVKEKCPQCQSVMVERKNRNKVTLECMNKNCDYQESRPGTKQRSR